MVCPIKVSNRLTLLSVVGFCLVLAFLSACAAPIQNFGGMPVQLTRAVANQDEAHLLEVTAEVLLQAIEDHGLGKWKETIAAELVEECRVYTPSVPTGKLTDGRCVAGSLRAVDNLATAVISKVPAIIHEVVRHWLPFATNQERVYWPDCESKVGQWAEFEKYVVDQIRLRLTPGRPAG